MSGTGRMEFKVSGEGDGVVIGSFLVIFWRFLCFLLGKIKNYGYEWDNIGNKKDGTELRVKVVIERDKWTQIVMTMEFRGRKAKRFRENKEKKTAKK